MTKDYRKALIALVEEKIQLAQKDPTKEYGYKTGQTFDWKWEDVLWALKADEDDEQGSGDPEGVIEDVMGYQQGSIESQIGGKIEFLRETMGGLLQEAIAASDPSSIVEKAMDGVFRDPEFWSEVASLVERYLKMTFKDTK